MLDLVYWMVVMNANEEQRRKIDRELELTSKRATTLVGELPEEYADLGEIDLPGWYPTDGEFDDVEWSTSTP